MTSVQQYASTGVEHLSTNIPLERGVLSTGFEEEVEPTVYLSLGAFVNQPSYLIACYASETAYVEYVLPGDLVALNIGTGSTEIRPFPGGLLPEAAQHVLMRAWGVADRVPNLNFGTSFEPSDRDQTALGYLPQISEDLNLDYTRILSVYDDRIGELRGIARDEGFEVDETSVHFFAVFLRNAPSKVRRAGLALGDQGEINAVWVSEDRQTRFSIEVFPDGNIEYAWLPSDGQVEVEPIGSSEFWSRISPVIRQFLLDAG